MLHWLAGQKPSENNADPDTTGYSDPPETPAPVFAVRAFKHAIFGTPATEKPKAPRWHSNTDNGRTGPARPRMVRPRSTNDAATLAKAEATVVVEPLPSPTKGILMTPGTVGGKRKTVTFPEHVVDNEQKRPPATGLPEDCPGKFPSPWTKSSTDTEHAGNSGQKSGGRSKLTEALEQAREENTKRKVRLGRAERQQQQEEDLTGDLAEPVSDSGKYWKREYDIYREKTTAEVKKLVAKQKLAKSYAKDKDDECLDLRDELAQERKLVDRLQRRTEDLEARLKEYQELLKQSRAAEASAKDELERVKRSSGSAGNRRPVETMTSHGLSSKNESESQSWQTSRTAATSAGGNPSEQQQPDERSLNHAETTRPRRRPREPQARPQDDPGLPSSTHGQQEPQPEQPSSRGHRAVTSGTGATPLQSLSINTVPKDSVSLAVSMGLKPPSPSPTREDKRQDSPFQQDHTTPPPPPPPPKDDVSLVLPSSPFDPDTTTTKPPPSPSVDRSARKELRRAAAVDAKENIRPRSKDGTAVAAAEKPSAAWSAMNAPVVLATVAPVRANAAAAAATGGERGGDKRQRALERARERLAQRGRVVS